jgi:hypothetical protein
VTLRRLALAGAAWGALALAAPAHADDPWAGIEVIADTEMAEMRGGLALPNGLDVGFGAVVTTYVNGLPALETRFTWGDTGPVFSELVGAVGTSLASMTPAQRDALGLGGLDGLGGVVIEDANGVTTLVHNVTEGSLQNIVLNTASRRDLSQHVELTLTLPGFEAVQEGLRQEIYGLRLAQDLANQLGGAALH